MKKMYILRGLPGSGKSTTINHLISKTLEEYPIATYSICSADNYFYRPDGEYDWNYKMLSNAHDWCYLLAGYRCEMSINLVFIDNTNIRKTDYQKYLDLAKEYNYEVEEVVVGKFDDESCKLYAERNVHKVPLESIRRMAQKFEA